MHKLDEVLNEDLFPGNTQTFEELKDSLMANQTIGFVGAGASAPLFPTWGAVLKILLSQARTRGFVTDSAEVQELETLIKEDPLEAASALEDVLTKPVFRTALSDVFRTRRECTATHQLIVSLGLKGIATLNYDDGLEVAFTSKYGRVANSIRSQDSSDVARWTQGAIFDARNIPILHWHGQPSDPINMVFTSEDYYNFYQDANHKRFVENLWQADRLLVIGFGFTDPFLTRIAEGTLRLSASGNRHFALIGYRGEEQISGLKRRNFSKKYRLTPIFYKIDMDLNGVEDHSGLSVILDKLGVAFPPDHSSKEGTAISGASPGLPLNTPEKSSDGGAAASRRDFESYLFSAPGGKTLYVEPRLLEPTQKADPNGRPEYQDVKLSELIGSSNSYVVKTNPEYGATTLCRRLLAEFSELGVEAYSRECDSLPNYQRKLRSEFPSINDSTIINAVLILDDFNPDIHDRLLKEIVGLKRFSRFIIILKSRNGEAYSALTDGAYGPIFNLVILSHLDRSDIRALSKDLFDTADEDFASSIVEKVYNDLLDLCIPLTPSNVVMYLSILYKEGDFHPLNRVQIVDRYIQELLKRPSDAYQDSFNAKNKIDVVSAFVYSLYKSKKATCFESDWYEFCRQHMDNTLISFNERALLNELLSSRILLRFDGVILFKYRFFYSYFLGRYVANRNSLLLEFMEHDDHLSAEGLVQVITFAASDNTEIVADLTRKLEIVLAELEEKYAFGGLDPFLSIEWPSTDTEEERLWRPIADKLASGPRSTQELDRLKTSIRSEVRTEDQTITFREFNVAERRMTAYAIALIDAITSSDTLEGALKKRSLNAIFGYYTVVYQIGLIYAPVIAKHRFTVWHDTVFSNEIYFTEGEDEAKRTFITSLSMAESVARKANREVGTKKLGEVYRVFAAEAQLAGFKQLLNFGLVLRSKSRNWQNIAEAIILKTDRKSFYMRTMLTLTLDQFYDEVNTNAEREGIKRIIATIRAKRALKKDAPGSKAISRVLDRLEKQRYFDNEDNSTANVPEIEH